MNPSSTKLAALAIAAIAAVGVTVLAVDEVLDGDDEYVIMQPPATAPAAVASPSSVAGAPPTGESSRPASEVPASDESAAAPSDAAPAAVPGSVTADQAKLIGAAAAGGTPIDVWPGNEGGRDVFYVDVRTETGLVEAYVDAVSGEVLRIEPGD